MNRLNNKVAIVTGAAGGIGKAIAELFLDEGALVVVTDKQEDTLQQWVIEKQKKGFAVEAVAHDITFEPDWLWVIEKTLSCFGKIDILINNAGVFPLGATTENTSLDDWNKIININLTGPFTGTKLCIPHLRSAGGGSVVNISSIAGLVGGNGPAYSASKAALSMLTKDQAVEFAKDNIRINAILPGGVLTPMTDFLVKDPSHDAIIKNMCPLQRIGLPKEIAYGALYLASGESTYSTGVELVIDGGLTAR